MAQAMVNITQNLIMQFICSIKKLLKADSQNFRRYCFERCDAILFLQVRRATICLTTTFCKDI